MSYTELFKFVVDVRNVSSGWRNISIIAPRVVTQLAVRDLSRLKSVIYNILPFFLITCPNRNTI